jgi:hypothetical protein
MSNKLKSKSPLDAATCSRSFWIQVREVTSVLGRRKTFFRALDTASGELITSSPQRRCAERVPVEVYGYAPISSENRIY